MSNTNGSQHIAFPAFVSCLIAIGLAVVMTLGLGLDPGSGADWLAASGTVVAVGAAVYAGIWAKSAYELEVARERGREEELLREQARTIVAWMTPPVFHGTALPNGETGRGALQRQAKVLIRNGSGMPVWEVDVKVYLQPSIDAEWEMLDGWQIPLVPPADEPTPLSLSGERWNGVYDAFRNPENRRPSLQASITFTDASGQRWLRRRDGRLIREGSSGQTSENVSRLG